MAKRLGHGRICVAAASSRNQVAPRDGRAGRPSPLVALFSEDLREDVGLGGAMGHEDHRSGDLEDPRMERDAGEMRLDARRGGHADHRPARVECGGARKDAQDTAVGTNPDQDQVEGRDTVDELDAGCDQLPGVALRGPVGALRLPDCRPDGDRVDVRGVIGAPAVLPPDTSTPDAPVPDSPLVAPISSRSDVAMWTFDSGWSAGTKRSSPHQRWTCSHGTTSRSGGCAR